MNRTSVSSQHVLVTPLEVFHTAKEFFPNATVQESSDEATPSIVLFLQEPIPPFKVSQAVMRKKFIAEMDFIRVLSRSDTICSTKVLGSHLINATNFTLPLKKLNGWQEFRRSMYEASGGKPSNLIIDFLRESADLRLLHDYGLHPDQLKDSPDPDLVHFKQIYKDIKGFTGDEKQKILATFQSTYPLIYERVQCQHAEELESQTPKVESENERLCRNYTQRLGHRVKGQEEAIKIVADFLSEINSSKVRDVGSRDISDQVQNVRKLALLFAGPSGVGKTELAKATAEIQGARFVQFKMTSYSQEQDKNRFTGMSRGFSSSSLKPDLAKQIDKFITKSNCVVDSESKKVYRVEKIIILFDEMEKAHTLVQDALMPIIDEGCYEFELVETKINLKTKEIEEKSVSYTYYLDKCLLIATSNLFKYTILESFKRGVVFENFNEVFEKWNSNPYADEIDEHDQACPTLRKDVFRQEFLLRFKVVPFGPIPRGPLYQGIIKKELIPLCKLWKNRFQFKECSIEDEQNVLLNIENTLYGEGYDIRRIKIRLESIASKFNTPHWKDPSKVKITFLVHEEKFCFRVDRFDEDLEMYFPLKLLHLPL